MVSQMVKASACNGRDQSLIPGFGKIPWRRKWQPTPVLSPGKFHGWRSLGGCYSPWGHKDSNRLSDFTFTFKRQKAYDMRFIYFWHSKQRGHVIPVERLLIKTISVVSSPWLTVNKFLPGSRTPVSLFLKHLLEKTHNINSFSLRCR